MKAAILILALFGLVPNASAQNRVWHYITRHKVLLASDVAVTLSHAADAASSVHCQNTNPGCSEGAWPARQLFGRHPSPAQFWFFSMSTAAVTNFGAHMWFHWQNANPDKGGTEFAFVLWTAPTCFVSGASADSNARTASARARVMGK